MKWHDFINLEIDYDSPADDDVAYLHPFENMTEEELSHYYNDDGKWSNVHSMTATAVTPENKNDSRDLVPLAVQLNLAEENDSPMDDDVINLFDSLTEEGHENCFARAFGGEGGTCECRGGCPPGPPLCW